MDGSQDGSGTPRRDRWSVVEEGARLALLWHCGAEAAPEREPGGTWLRRLEEKLFTVAFERCAATVELSDSGAIATNLGGRHGGWKPAVAGRAMMSGRHACEVQYLAGEYMLCGVVGAGFIPHAAGVHPAHKHPEGWLFKSTNWQLAHAGEFSLRWLTQRSLKEQAQSLGAEIHATDNRETARRVGLLLDLDEGSLAVSVDGRRLGRMVKKGLQGPLWWGVDLAPEGGSARIERRRVSAWSGSPR